MKKTLQNIEFQKRPKQYIQIELWILRAAEWFWLQLNSNIFFV